MDNTSNVIPKVNLQLDRIRKELGRAMKVHAPMNSPHEAYAVILEEVDEFWDDVKINPKKLDQCGQDKRKAHMQMELLQIAAMCIRATIDCDLMG